MNNDFGSYFVSEWRYRPLAQAESVTVAVLSSLHTFNVRRCMILFSIRSVYIIYENVVKSSPVTGLEWPRGFQEVKVPKFIDNGTGWL
jgi:hypothetical protein